MSDSGTTIVLIDSPRAFEDFQDHARLAALRMRYAIDQRRDIAFLELQRPVAVRVARKAGSPLARSVNNIHLYKNSPSAKLFRFVLRNGSNEPKAVWTLCWLANSPPSSTCPTSP
jgi:hypothetical protein